MSISGFEEPKRICEWCKKEISEDAIKCPNCGAWRRDVKEDRNKAYGWLTAFCFVALLVIIGMTAGWWKETSSFLGIQMEVSRFSWSSFFSSGLGWFFIILFVITLWGSFHYWRKVSDVIGTWWWI